jgi:hypothetical protein
MHCIFVAAASLGCQAFHQYRPVCILVQDAETKKPIAGAEVLISSPLTEPSFAPWNSSGVTSGDGIVRLRATPYGEFGIAVEAKAKGYLDEVKDVSLATVRALEPAGFFEPPDNRPPNVIIEMYAEPRAIVELIVPTGYRGQIKVQIQAAQNDALCQPGQRSFTYAVRPSGIVEITGPPLLGHVCATDFHAKYADGTPLTRHAKDGEVGLWWLRRESSYFCFLVGTRSECNEVLTSYQTQGGEIRSHGSGKSEGHGRRGHRSGGQSPSDAGLPEIMP